MSTFVIFFVSLFLVVFSLIMKGVEISRGRKIFLAETFAKSDEHLFAFLIKIKKIWRQINFNNTKLFFRRILDLLKNQTRLLKRRFDHKQSHFFSKREHDSASQKGSASFFLKNIAEHKKALREKAETDRMGKL